MRSKVTVLVPASWDSHWSGGAENVWAGPGPGSRPDSRTLRSNAAVIVWPSFKRGRRSSTDHVNVATGAVDHHLGDRADEARPSQSGEEWRVPRLGPIAGSYHPSQHPSSRHH